MWSCVLVEIFFHFLRCILVVCLSYPSSPQESLHLFLWHVVPIKLSPDVGGHEGGLSGLDAVGEEVWGVQHRPVEGGVVAEHEWS